MLHLPNPTNLPLSSLNFTRPATLNLHSPLQNPTLTSVTPHQITTMDLQKKKEKPPLMTPTTTTTQAKDTCTNPRCFFCLMDEPESPVRREGIAHCFKEMPRTDNKDHVLTLSGLWNIAMAQPDDPEFPSLGIFHCMASLIRRGLTDTDWLLEDQNVYIPYYAAHVIGSYTMNKSEFAEMAVDSGVIPPLIELLGGKMSWVEQRVAARALGHLASYESTFESVAEYEEVVVKLAMDSASTCLELVYAEFVGVKEEGKRVKYHIDLLTRGIGGVDMENRKAEEWASQLQCWSLYLLNSFAIKERGISLICNKDFLRDLCGMWGGLVNHTSPAGVGLIRILCYTAIGRRKISESDELLEKLCKQSRSSDDWQYMGIDCLLLLLNDPNTRYKVFEIVVFSLVDLVELRTLGERNNVGNAITRTLLMDFKLRKSKVTSSRVKEVLEELWDLKVERTKREKKMGDEKVEERRILVSLIKQQGNHSFWVGEIGEALLKYTEALELCPVRLRKERIVLYSNRAQCHLLLGDADKAISDATRALSLSSPVNSHGKSLWRRSQAYDMKGLAKESLMDCLVFINGCSTSCTSEGTTKNLRIPYYAARMISKQMDLAWLFADARSKISNNYVDKARQSDCDDDDNDELSNYEKLRTMIETKGFATGVDHPCAADQLVSGLSTIMEEPLTGKGGCGRKKLDKVRERKNAAALALSP